MKEVLIAMLVMASFSAMAQKGPHHGERHGMKDLSPEQMATLQTKKLTLALDLTKSQQEAVQQLNLENAKLRKEKMEKIKADRDGEERQKPSSEERFAMQNERLDHMISQKEKMKKILSPEQYEKWEKGHHQKRKHGDRRGKHQHRGKR
jgi:Spy/CpxP family protein refolding chaperone